MTEKLGLTEKLLDDETLVNKQKLNQTPSNFKNHWYWDSWKYLALTASLCFAVANLLIGHIAHLGMASIFYYNSGGLLTCTIYFAVRKLRPSKTHQDLFTTNGRFDSSLAVCYVAGAMFGVLIYLAINTTFYFCHRAGLNLGIAATIWGFTALLSSLMEYNYYGTEMLRY